MRGKMTGSRNEHPALAKSLGVIRLSLYRVGTIIGAGIYSVIAPAAGAAGDGIWLSLQLRGCSGHRHDC